MFYCELRGMHTALIKSAAELHEGVSALQSPFIPPPPPTREYNMGDANEITLTGITQYKLFFFLLKLKFTHLMMEKISNGLHLGDLQ